MINNFQKHFLDYDILIAGGGMAGVPCAIAAARQGVKVILIQDRSMLGGNASSEIRMHILGANTSRRGRDLILETRESGLIEEIRLENAFRNPQRSPSMFDQILYEKCLAEPMLTLMLDTRVIVAQVDGGKIMSVEAIRASTEDHFTIRADVFIDCTGDGGLGASAGALFTQGREDRAAFGEALAREQSDRKTLGSTLLLMARKHDCPVPYIPPPWARKFSEDDLKFRRHAALGESDYGLEYGFWWLEWGGHLDTIKDNAAIRHELLSIVHGIWDHIKNDGDHGAENWALDWFGAVPGKRESRRFIGQHVLTEHDVLTSQKQPDAIAYGGWAIDIHPPEGVDLPDDPPCTQAVVPLLYDIPLRCCVARDLSNLMFAGRNISATHVAFASTRVMATCAAVGEGVGVSAAHAVKNKIPPIDLAADSTAMHAIRQELLRQDVFLIGQKYLGEQDLALTATITASSETSEGRAREVISAQNRAVQGERGVSPERELAGTHRWISRQVPAWLELRWENPVEIAEVVLVFDTGLHRNLTLTQSDGLHRTMVWGTGQPEMVKAYRLEWESVDGWHCLATISRNWQRRAKHSWPPSTSCRAIRLHIDEMWGIDQARVVQIRVYSENDKTSLS